MKEVWIDGDGQCALRAITAGVYPTLDRGEDDERVGEMRRDLLGELRGWGVRKWMDVTPNYGVMGLVVEEPGKEDRRTSYDCYVDFLSEPKHHRTYLDHAIFYLAHRSTTWSSTSWLG